LDLLTLLCRIFLNYKPYSTIADLRSFCFTAAHVLGFSVSTNRLLATDLNTGTIALNHYEVFFSFLLQSPWNADPVLHSNSPVTNLYSTNLLPLTELTVILATSLYSRGTDTHHRKHVRWPLLTVMLRHRASQKTRHLIV
jgi:hypothetical protein